MKIPKVISKNGNEYILLKKYKNFILYRNMLTGVNECFSEYDLGLIDKQPIIRQSSKHNIR